MLMIVEVISFPAPAGCSRARLLQRRASAFLGFWVRSAPHGTPRITCGGGEGDTPNRADERTQTGR
jgi:hypothetical protein